MQQVLKPPAGQGPTCPTCKTKTIQVRLALVAKPVGTFSLAGAQMKVSAISAAFAECTTCTLSVRGELVGAVLADDGKTYVGGQFVSDSARTTS